MRWLSDVVRSTVRPSTWESYERLLRVQVLPEIGRLPLSRLGPQNLAQLYQSMLDRGCSARTAQYAHAVLHRALRQAVRWNLIVRNPAEFVDPPRPQRPSNVVLNPDQINALIVATNGDPLRALYVLAITSGMRQGELLGLKWADVNLEAGSIHVCRQIMRTRAGFVFSDPKTAKGRRTIVLPDLAVVTLRDHRQAQIAKRLAAGLDWEDYDLVFPNAFGRPLERQNVLRRSFQPLLSRAGVPRIRFHDLRHSAATLPLLQGVHPKVVQERLGHATISVTMDIYSHVLPNLQREAADKLDDFFAAARTS
jgi:integrase